MNRTGEGKHFTQSPSSSSLRCERGDEVQHVPGHGVRASQQVILTLQRQSFISVLPPRQNSQR